MFKVLLLFFAMLLPFQSFCGGLSAWQENTPNDNILYHDGTSTWISFTFDNVSSNENTSFEFFYFFKQHIVAYTTNNHYIIIDEKNSKIQHFTNKDHWEEQIKSQKLRPFIKREFDKDYSSAFGPMPFFVIHLLLPFPFFFPVFWLFCLISSFFIKNKKRLSLRKLFVIIYPIIILIVVLLTIFPQSI